MTSTRIASYRADVGRLELYVSDCASCGVVFGISTDLEQRRRDDGGTFYCPNGHTMTFGKDRAARLQQQLDSTQQRLRWAEAREQAQRREREAAERSARAYRGHVTRLRNRIAAGVCPVTGCRRSFSNVVQHIQGQHPDWAHEHAEVLA